MFKVALSEIVKNCKWRKFAAIEKWINKLSYSHKINLNSLYICVSAWINLNHVHLSEQGKVQKDTYIKL